MNAPTDVRTRIVMAAMELLWAKGYNSTSIADILSRTQLNAGSLYHVFPGKQDVLITFVDDDHRIFRNIGGARFVDMTDNAGLGGKGTVAGPAAVLDFDRDGRPDIYIGHFGDYPQVMGNEQDRHAQLSLQSAH